MLERPSPRSRSTERPDSNLMRSMPSLMTGRSAPPSPALSRWNRQSNQTNPAPPAHFFIFPKSSMMLPFIVGWSLVAVDTNPANVNTLFIFYWGYNGVAAIVICLLTIINDTINYICFCDFSFIRNPGWFLTLQHLITVMYFSYRMRNFMWSSDITYGIIIITSNETFF